MEMNPDSPRKGSVAVVYGVPAGAGGLGVQAANVIASLAGSGPTVHAFGPAGKNSLALLQEPSSIVWHQAPQLLPAAVSRYTPWRWYQGQFQFQTDRLIGHWARTRIEESSPDLCYVFTQVGLETLKWAKAAGVPTVLDNPNGHIRHYREVCVRESKQWCDSGYSGHPTEAMVQRVEEEYALADRIRVSSQWAKDSMVAHGVLSQKIEVIAQPIDLTRFRPSSTSRELEQPLRICFVGQVNLAKGFVYLTRAIKQLGARHASLEIVGATGDRQARRLFEQERADISVISAPGDPVPAYHRNELLVLPSLHDGFGFVVAEAMACGLPVIVTEDCGAAGLVRENESGWIVPAGEVEPLALALEDALTARRHLANMGSRGRLQVQADAGPRCLNSLRAWVWGDEELAFA